MFVWSDSGKTSLILVRIGRSLSMLRQATLPSIRSTPGTCP